MDMKICLENVWKEDLNNLLDSIIFRQSKNEISSGPTINDVAEIPSNKEFRCDWKLSYDNHPSYPGMANVLKIKKNETFGRHIVAKHDIDVGKTVLVEEHFMKSIASSHEEFTCQTCFGTENVNFISCDLCPFAKFCDIECKNANPVHSLDCETFYNPHLHNTETLTSFKLLIRTIILAVRSFPSVGDLIRFVEDVNKPANKKIFPQSTSTFASKYRAFLTLHPCCIGIPLEFVFIALKQLDKIQFIANRFKSRTERRFLMNLVLHHELILRGNAFSDNEQASIGIIASFFNHSCAPNLANYSRGKFRCLTTIRPVKKGEQLFISYTGDSIGSTKERQKFLREFYGFSCRCDKCEAPLIQKTDLYRMLRDPDYKHVVHFNTAANLIGLQPFFYQSYVRNSGASAETACVNFLNRFGHLPWTKKLEFVTEVYQKVHFQDADEVYGFSPSVSVFLLVVLSAFSYFIYLLISFLEIV